MSTIDTLLELRDTRNIATMHVDMLRIKAKQAACEQVTNEALAALQRIIFDCHDAIRELQPESPVRVPTAPVHVPTAPVRVPTNRPLTSK